MPLKFSGPDIGELPRFGLRGADDGEYILAGDGPVEQHSTSEVGRGMTDIVHQKEAKWVDFLSTRQREKHFIERGVKSTQMVVHRKHRKLVLPLSNSNALQVVKSIEFKSA
ncbi:hypothetical protein TH3_11315 [Thalassospira xiamenensis M-5 = DSM 17429]|uniref:Uncharacterized protein n=1 Tax=Thalassospira xiamenensis M-5 = DSM 17429 TaxID=1123366 RepID=A0AB72UED6_9PROT|nr:hypothetical protein TH3_11315 [Thalassospira xiamenensis M-5 = DSM 17429]